MPEHSVSRVWVHLTWGTRRRSRYLIGDAASRVKDLLIAHAVELGLEVRAIYVNADHVHILLLHPPDRQLSDTVKLLKGRSSRLVSRDRIAQPDFAWATGYGAFSVSRADLEKVTGYINRQLEHHRKKAWTEVVEDLLGEFDLADRPFDGASPD